MVLLVYATGTPDLEVFSDSYSLAAQLYTVWDLMAQAQFSMAESTAKKGILNRFA